MLLLFYYYSEPDRTTCISMIKKYNLQIEINLMTDLLLNILLLTIILFIYCGDDCRYAVICW